MSWICFCRSKPRKPNGGWIITQGGIFEIGVEYIQPETIDPFFKPEAEHIQDALCGPAGCASSDRVVLLRTCESSTHPLGGQVPSRHRQIAIASYWVFCHSLFLDATYTNRGNGLSRLLRDWTNQGCLSEVWFSTRSMMMRIFLIVRFMDE